MTKNANEFKGIAPLEAMRYERLAMQQSQNENRRSFHFGN